MQMASRRELKRETLFISGLHGVAGDDIGREQAEAGDFQKSSFVGSDVRRGRSTNEFPAGRKGKSAEGTVAGYPEGGGAARNHVRASQGEIPGQGEKFRALQGEIQIHRGSVGEG